MGNDKSSRRSFLQTAAAGTAGLSFLSHSAQGQPPKKRPNIIVIMADDMGFSDPGCFGGEIQTPHLDRLARNGIRFTQFYNCARCCPTRASLMTGLYPHQVGLAKNGRSLTRDGMTIAEGLKSAGYNTAMSGKWHLSYTPTLQDKKQHQKWLDHQYDPGRPFGPKETYPVNRGFDRYYGNIWGVVNYFDPFSLVEGTQPVKTVPADYYITDAITDRAVQYIQDFSKEEKPFFLYVAHCAPHWPLHARPEDIQKYKDRYKKGWNQLRKERFERQLKMGVFEKANTQLPGVQMRNDSDDWDILSAKERDFQADKMAVHAAMVDRMDQGIGRMVDTLESTGQMENTVIFFLADNGASPEVPQRPGYDRTGETRDGREVQYQGDFEPGPETTYTGIGSAWSSASNTPFRYWKKQSFEGGCHTPMIVHWPKGMSGGGSVTEQPGHVMDIMPTCLDLAGAKYPEEYQGHRLLPLEGKSLLPILQGQTREPHAKLFFEHMNGRAVRMGDWKLVAHSSTPRQWRLYNLAADRTEMHDLAETHPDKVKEMAQAWTAWARKVGLK
ncbi:sulfatase-like hydrolase/transferase [bacterium]|nr:sulfatase-like hydrolase/transferase [bacterium]